MKIETSCCIFHVILDNTSMKQFYYNDNKTILFNLFFYVVDDSTANYDNKDYR
jgi:trehalose-6-phosphate synthase